MRPPTLDDLRNYNVNRANQAEVIWQPLYDYQSYPAAGQTELNFFQVPVGQGATSSPGATGTKTIADTNMKSAGQLPQPTQFLLTGIEILFYPGQDVNASGAIGTSGLNWDDVYTVGKSGALRLFIGSKDYLVDSPIMMFPPEKRLAGAAAMADATTAAGALHSQIDYATFAGRPYAITPVNLIANQNFNVSLEWPTAVALNEDARIGVRLNGWLYRLSQ